MNQPTVQPTISAILPAYNAALYIGDAVRSVVEQSFKDWELIIVDDGSDDDTVREALKAAAGDKRVTIVSVANGGPSSARNHGLTLSKGRYVIFIDADDELHPRAMEALLSYSDEADIVIAQYVEGPTSPFHTDSSLPSPLPPATDLTAEEALRLTLYQHPLAHNSPCAHLFERSLFDEVSFVKGLRYEDLEITPRIYMKARRIALTPLPVYFYRVNPDSFLHQWNPSRCDVLKVTSMIEQWAATSSPAMLPAARSRRFSAAFNIFLVAPDAGPQSASAKSWSIIRSLRRDILADPDTRLRNKLGALLSFLGPKGVKLIARLFYKPF